VLARPLVEPARHEPPRLAVVGHAGVLEAVEAPLVELDIDEGQDRDARLAVLGEHGVAECVQGPRLRLVEEAQRGGSSRARTTCRVASSQ